MIKARLGYETFSKYRDKLVREGKMITSSPTDEHGRTSKTYYSLTREGMQLLEDLSAERPKKGTRN